MCNKCLDNKTYNFNFGKLKQTNELNKLYQDCKFKFLL